MKNYLMVGVGGIGMSALAAMLIQNEKSVIFGIDANKSKYKELENKGIKMCSRLEDVNWKIIDEIICSSAIKKNDNVFKYAKQFGVKVKKRPEKLYELMKFYRYVIGISGTHGKTTTTGILSHIFIESNKKASSYIGGILLNYDSNFVFKGNDFLISELDESDGYLSNLSVNAGIITNVELEHVDFYENISALNEVFFNFVDKIKQDGYIIVGNVSKKFLKNIKKDRIIVLDSNNSYFQLKVNNEFREIILDGNIIKVDNKFLLGNYNLNNAALASACAYMEGVKIEDIKKGVNSFKGVKRRFEVISLRPKIVISDYAHHPTEIKAVVSNVKEVFPNKKIVFVFQPHRITRFRIFFNDFLDSFKKCEQVVVTDIYTAGEEGNAENLPKIFVQELKKKYLVDAYFSEIFDVNDFLKEKISADVYVFLGAGSIDVYARKFPEYYE